MSGLSSVALCLIVTAGPMASAEEAPGGHTVPRVPPHRLWQDLDSGVVEWTEGFWADRFRLCREATVPSVGRALEDANNAAFLGNFRAAAEGRVGAYRGKDWSDGDCYKWLESLAHLYAATKDPALDRRMDEVIALIAEAQEDDGYIGTQIQLTGRERWSSRRHHELYNMGHLMTAAAVHYRATGKKTLVDVAVRLADYLYGVFVPPSPRLANYGWNPSNIMGLVDLYGVTGDERYLELAQTFVDMRGSMQPQPAPSKEDPNPGDQNQNRRPLREESRAVGHAVTATYLYCGAADVYGYTGERALLAALERIWTNMVQRRMYITGGIGSCHRGQSDSGDTVHEAFTTDYDLPNDTAYCETCANIGNAMFNWRMLALTGDARYADVLERVMYNAGLSGMSIDGKRFFYTNPLARAQGQPMLMHDTPERWDLSTDCYCCPPQMARTLAGMGRWIYSVSPRALWVHLFGGSRLRVDIPDCGPVAVEQTTSYPWEGSVTLLVREAPETPFAIRVRIPGWTPKANISVNGEPAQVRAVPGTYCAVERTWRPRDRVTLELEMPAVAIEPDPNVEANRGRVAFMRGPVVYCLESAGLPEDLRLEDLRVDPRAPVTVEHRPELLGGVTVLQTTVSGKDGPVPVELIPYYAWCHRGIGELAVWLRTDKAPSPAEAVAP